MCDLLWSDPEGDSCLSGAVSLQGINKVSFLYQLEWGIGFKRLFPFAYADECSRDERMGLQPSWCRVSLWWRHCQDGNLICFLLVWCSLYSQCLCVS